MYADLIQLLTQLTCKTVPVIWADQCQKALEILDDELIKSALLAYPDLNKPYTLFTEVSIYAWSLVLTLEHTFVIDS